MFQVLPVPADASIRLMPSRLQSRTSNSAGRLHAALFSLSSSMTSSSGAYTVVAHSTNSSIERVVHATKRESIRRVEFFREGVESGASPRGDGLGDSLAPGHVAPGGFREEVDRTLQPLAVEPEQRRELPARVLDRAQRVVAVARVPRCPQDRLARCHRVQEQVLEPAVEVIVGARVVVAVADETGPAQFAEAAGQAPRLAVEREFEGHAHRVERRLREHRRERAREMVEALQLPIQFELAQAPRRIFDPGARVRAHLGQRFAFEQARQHAPRERVA